MMILPTEIERAPLPTDGEAIDVCQSQSILQVPQMAMQL